MTPWDIWDTVQRLNYLELCVVSVNDIFSFLELVFKLVVLKCQKLGWDIFLKTHRCKKYIVKTISNKLHCMVKFWISLEVYMNANRMLWNDFALVWMIISLFMIKSFLWTPNGTYQTFNQAKMRMHNNRESNRKLQLFFRRFPIIETTRQQIIWAIWKLFHVLSRQGRGWYI